MLASSRQLSWTSIAAELRSHPPGEIEAIQPDQVEVTIAVHGDRTAIVSRKGAGLRQETPVLPGQIWISPAGIVEDDIRITRPLSRILHLYLPTTPSPSLAAVFGERSFSADSLRYLAGGKDDLIQQVGLSLLGEMANPTAAGRVFAESLAHVLSVRLLQAYTGGRKPNPEARPADHGRLDDVRMRRVIDYMMANLDQDIGLEDLAHAANLSAFHFCRLFKRSTGAPPHRYLAGLRIDAAKDMLAHGHMPLAHIADACSFTSHAAFSRAFKQATGTTPLEYRNLHASRQG